MINLKTLSKDLSEKGNNAERGFPFQINPIPGEVEVLQILVEDREELPIFVSISEEQILCIAYLFKKNEVKSDKINEMNHAMLAASISMPLSSFALVDDQYVIYGALSINSSSEEIVHEIEVLSSNTIEAIEAMSDYLN